MAKLKNKNVTSKFLATENDHLISIHFSHSQLLLSIYPNLVQTWTSLQLNKNYCNKIDKACKGNSQLSHLASELLNISFNVTSTQLIILTTGRNTIWQHKAVFQLLF